MSESLLCIDIQNHFVAALLVDKNAKTRIVKACGFAERLDNSLEQAITAAVAQTGYTKGQSIVTLGAEEFIYRNIVLPFSDRKKIEQILPFELESLSAVDINQLVFDCSVGAHREQGSDVVVAMIQKEKLSECIEALKNAGLEPERLGISGLALSSVLPAALESRCVIIDVVDKWATLFVSVDGSVCIIRSIPAPAAESTDPNGLKTFLFEISQTLFSLENMGMEASSFDLYLSGALGLKQEMISVLAPQFNQDKIHTLTCSKLPLMKIDPEARSTYKPEVMDRLLATALTGKKQVADYNFRKGEFKAKRSPEEIFRIAAKLTLPLVIVAVLGVSYLFYEFRELRGVQRELDSQIRNVFTTTLPEVTRIVNPLQQMQIIRNDVQKSFRPGGEGTGSHTVVTILTELSARIPARYSFKVLKMVVEKETIRLKAETGDFNIVDNIKKELAKSAMFSEVVIASANQSSKADKITCELKIYLAQ